MSLVFTAMLSKKDCVIGLASSGLLSAFDLSILTDPAKLHQFIAETLQDTRIKTDELESMVIASPAGMMTVVFPSDDDTYSFSFRAVNPATHLPDRLAEAYNKLMPHAQQLADQVRATLESDGETVH